MSEEIKELEPVVNEQAEEETKRAPAIVAFIFSIIAYINLGSLLSLIFSIVSLSVGKKAKGVKTTLHQVFLNISKPVSIVCLILNILIMVTTTIMLCVISILVVVFTILFIVQAAKSGTIVIE